MAVLPYGNEVALNGATPVTLVAAPTGTNKRGIDKDAAGIHNLDSVSHTFTFQKNKAATITVIWKVTGVAAGGAAIMPKKVVLDATDESLEVVMEGAHTTTAPRADVAYLEWT